MRQGVPGDDADREGEVTTAAELKLDRRQNKGSVSAQILPSRGVS